MQKEYADPVAFKGSVWTCAETQRAPETSRCLLSIKEHKIPPAVPS
jgi:hypothetical protein